MLKNRHLTDDEIAIYADAIIANRMEEIPAEWQQHMADCALCAHKMLSVSEIVDDVNDDKNSLKHFDEKDRGNESAKIFSIKRNYLVIIAASVLFMLTTSLMYFQITRDTDKYRIDYSESDNIAYTENKNLENLVERYSGASLRDVFNVNTKSSIEIIDDDRVVLSWNNESEEVLTIEFFNNTEEKLFEVECSGNNYETDYFSSKGLYYWKLLNEDFDLVFCGKIIVK